MVSHVVHGMEQVEELFDIMRKAENFGKLVVAVSSDTRQMGDGDLAKL